MSQIFSRFKRYIKSETASDDGLSNAKRIINSDDDELSSIIDDLNKQKEEKSTKKETYTNSEMNTDRAYSILGIQATASIDEIKSAYKTKLKEYHPDRVAHLGDELKELSAKKTREIISSYEFLKELKDF